MSMLRLDYAKTSETFGSYRVPAEALEFELRKPFDALVSAANRENGWVNWPGLATLLSEMTDTLADSVSTLSVHV